MSTTLTGTIKFRVSESVEREIRRKRNVSDWVRMAVIERLERERLERLADSSKQKESE
ncbi:TPA: hypothetical protein VGT19_005452 [Vibrio harveyi]|nr:hypothetical protein [Vibrio harveyi]